MIELDQFLGAAGKLLGHDLSSNANQYDIVTMPTDVSVKVVAGPGSGKTTVIVLRILKSIYVDGVDPSKIVATTFTVKASKELKSRILSWGETLRQTLLNNPAIPGKEKTRLRRLNFDAVVTGTLDSIAETVRSDNREAYENPIVLIDEYLSLRLMNQAVLKHGTTMFNNLNIEYREHNLGGEGNNWNINIVKSLLDVYSRAKENSVDIDLLADRIPNYVKVMKTYDEILHEKQFVDFPELEQEFLRFLGTERSHVFTDRLSLLMIDEYQDTNALQEKIYFKLAESVVRNSGSLMVVGDDDQSIYRFRGSRVILFSDLEKRIEPVGVKMITRFLSVNYRSTPEIVKFCNDFVSVDEAYQVIRIGEKPLMRVGRTECDNIPVIGIFRDSKEDLADAIEGIVRDYAQKGVVRIRTTDGQQYVIRRPPEGGVGDIAFLCRSPQNYSSGSKPRLPLMLRQRLENGSNPIRIFNPRGTPLHSVPNVSILCGLLLECLDPKGAVEGSIWRSDKTQDIMAGWRHDARAFIGRKPVVNGVALEDYVRAWQDGKPLNGTWDKSNVPILDIVYNLITWMPSFRNDAEGLVYLQAITNAISQSVHVNTKDACIDFVEKRPDGNSVKAMVRDVLVQIAEGVIEIEEDLLFTVNTLDRLNIMSIHQSKVLEFPINIVDVGSDYTGNYQTQERYRFPTKLDSTSVIDNLMRKFMEDYGERDYVNQMFDALIRQMFVAYSRTQDVLILVGHSKSLGPVKNVAIGWTRDGQWRWRGIPDVKMMEVSHGDKHQKTLF